MPSDRGYCDWDLFLQHTGEHRADRRRLGLLLSAAGMTTERPARKQVARPVAAEEPVDKANYNIWHHRPKFRGKAEPKKAAAHRCRPARDAGKTRGSESGASFCCIDFARGVCAAGPQCNYLHRVPTAQVRACFVESGLAVMAQWPPSVLRCIPCA